jgi:hypothetical protein
VFLIRVVRLTWETPGIKCTSLPSHNFKVIFDSIVTKDVTMAQPIHPDVASIQNAQRNGVVAGLASTGRNLPRLDIDQMLLTQPDTFNLFLLALEKIQSTGTADKWGWFQLSGV